MSDQLDKHTPGPWEAAGPFVRSTFTIKRIGKPDICHLYKDGIPSDEVKANAALIAAAPELLAALREVRSRFASVSEHGAIEVAITSDLYTQIETTIAKALGQAQP